MTQLFKLLVTPTKEAIDRARAIMEKERQTNTNDWHTKPVKKRKNSHCTKRLQGKKSQKKQEKSKHKIKYLL